MYDDKEFDRIKLAAHAAAHFFRLAEAASRFGGVYLHSYSGHFVARVMRDYMAALGRPIPITIIKAMLAAAGMGRYDTMASPFCWGDSFPLSQGTMYVPCGDYRFRMETIAKAAVRAALRTHFTLYHNLWSDPPAS